MAIPPDTQLDDPETRRDLRLVWLTCVGPGLWLSLLTVVYAVSDHECGYDTAPYSWALTVAGIALCAVCMRALARLGPPPVTAAQAAPGAKAQRQRTMVHAGLALNALSIVLLLGFMAPLLFLRPCE